jgi:hypothetical protein
VTGRSRLALESGRPERPMTHVAQMSPIPAHPMCGAEDKNDAMIGGNWVCKL